MARDNSVEREKLYRSLPLWLASEYLQALGGVAQNENQVQGAEWSVTLSEAEEAPIGALRIGQIRVVFRAAPGSLDSLIAAFEKKAMRAGG